MNDDIFYLGYGGLPWSPDAILEMTIEERKLHLKRLMEQKQHEQEELAKLRKGG